MKEEKELQKLLDRFLAGSSTSEENMQLLNLLEKNSSELDRLVDSIWKEKPDLTETGDGAEILEKLHQKLGFHDKAVSSGGTRFLGLIIRYAAIFVLGFGIALLIMMHQKSTVNENPYKIKVAYGSKTTLELSDGTVVVLNSGSTLTYSNFNGSEREVVLNGEAFFDVKKDPSRPFLVKTKDITVRVLGTKFNVKSYPEENFTETTLVSGKVEILTGSEIKNNKIIELAPNQKAVFYQAKTELAVNESDKTEKTAPSKILIKPKLLVQKDIKTETVISWKNDILVFNSEPFGEIIKKLERWYGVEITLKYSKLSPVVFSGKFDKESVQEVLHALSLIEPFSFDITKNKILIYK